MIDLATHAALAQDTIFRGRVQAAIVQYAYDATNDSTSEKAELVLSKEILNSYGAANVDQFVWILAGDEDIVSAYVSNDNQSALISDEVITTALDKAWATMVNLRQPETPTNGASGMAPEPPPIPDPAIPPVWSDEHAAELAAQQEAILQQGIEAAASVGAPVAPEEVLGK